MTTLADNNVAATRPAVSNLADNNTGVSWGAILAGAAAAAALSIILLLLGFGIGMSAISPWEGEGVSMTTLGFGTVIWLFVTHVLGSGLGGYLAGRLRVKWAGVHTDEVYFRDTAHGLITWAVAMLVTTIMVSGGLMTVLGGGVRAGGELAGGAADNDYFVDALLRPGEEQLNQERAAERIREEIGNIISRTLATGEFTEQDRQYLINVIAQETGIDPNQAQQRIDDAVTQTQEAADTARSVAARAALWSFVALLSGAFAASLLATFGGRQRDNL